MCRASVAGLVFLCAICGASSGGEEGSAGGAAPTSAACHTWAGAGECDERASALHAWRERRALGGDLHATLEVGGEEAGGGLLIVDLSFGGLSNRRQSLMLAAAAARLTGRRLVLAEYFDQPYPASFGACQHCVRPLAYYYNMSRLRAFVPLATFEDLYARLEDEGALQARVVCKGRGTADPLCMAAPPTWLRQDLSWNAAVTQLQHAGDPSGLEPVREQALYALRSVAEPVLWLDTAFRLLALGDLRAELDGSAASRALREACHGCVARCHSAEHNPVVQQAGWCDPRCRRECEGTCSAACHVDDAALRGGARLADCALPQHIRSLLSSLDHVDALKDAGRVAFARLRGKALARAGGSGGSGGGVAEDGVMTVCAHWRVGDWSFPMAADTLVASVGGAVRIALGGEAGGAGAGRRRWATRDTSVTLLLASDASEEQRAAVGQELVVEAEDGGGTLELQVPVEVIDSRQVVREGGGALREDGWEAWEEDAVQLAILDQLTCAHADVFVGTRLSTFSEAIVEERLRLGKPLPSNFLVP